MNCVTHKQFHNEYLNICIHLCPVMQGNLLNQLWPNNTNLLVRLNYIVTQFAKFSPAKFPK